MLDTMQAIYIEASDMDVLVMAVFFSLFYARWDFMRFGLSLDKLRILKGFIFMTSVILLALRGVVGFCFIFHAFTGQEDSMATMGCVSTSYRCICQVKSGIFGHQINSDTHLQTV